MNTTKPVICYFPGRESGYPRNRVLLKGMRNAGFVVNDCSCQKKIFFRYFFSFLKFLKYRKKCDIVFVGFLGHLLVPVVKIFTKKPVVFDAFLSMYQTLAYDRRSISPKGICATIVRFAEKKACMLADVVFLDTQQHIDYYISEYRLKINKFSRLFVGSDDSVMHPSGRKSFNKKFTVHFHGEFQALHGVEHIVSAAELLPDISFRMIGSGRQHSGCLKMVKDRCIGNVDFIGPVSYEKLREYLSEADVCLGIFGDTQKTRLVIPHKVFEALAMKKPLITADTPAVRELLDENSVMLCMAADGVSLANAVVRLRDDEKLRVKLAENGYNVFIEKCTPEKLGKRIYEVCRETLLRQGV